MTGCESPVFVAEFGLTLIGGPAGQVHLMGVLMLLDLLGRFRRLTRASRGCEEDGETRDRERQHENASYSATKQIASNLTRQRVTLAHLGGNRHRVFFGHGSILENIQFSDWGQG